MSPRQDEHRGESGFRAREWCTNLLSALAKFHHRFNRFMRRSSGLPLLLIRELESDQSVSFLRKLALWKKGFISPSYVLFQLDRNGFDNFVSDYAAVCRARLINEKYAILLQDKYAFDCLLSPFSEHLPKFFGIVSGRRAEFGPLHGSVATADDILQLLATERELVLKLQTGKGGAGFKILSFKEEALAINDEPVSQEAFRRMIVDYPPALLYARVQQHPTLSKFYPRTTNTLRIMTMWDDATDRPYIAAIVQMIGTSLSYPTDHWGAGGLCVYVDSETGQMGKGVSPLARGRSRSMAGADGTPMDLGTAATDVSTVGTGA